MTELKNTVIMHLKEGMPTTPGWYFVELFPGHIDGDRKYDVDYCGEKNESGMEWLKWYQHNISRYAVIAA